MIVIILMMNIAWLFSQIGEREYADLVKMMDQEEQLSATLTLADQHAKIQETQRESIIIDFMYTNIL